MNESKLTKYFLKSIFVLLLSCLVFQINPNPGLAMDPPTQGDVIKYQKEGSIKQRINFANNIGNDKVNSSLMKSFYKKTFGESLHINELPNLRKGLPTTGSPKVAVLLIDFPDYPHKDRQTVAEVDASFFGDGLKNNYPYESVTNYYKRSSYGKLEIKGNVLGWYRASKNRSYYSNLEENSGRDVLISEAVEYFAAQGHDFTQYDNDKNGDIEGLYIKWTGPDTGWGSFWWAYKSSYSNPGYTVQGKRIADYVWSMYEKERNGQIGYHPLTDIHETGHLLGLPDYYDYDTKVGPSGGLGGIDMMDKNKGDHNSFSKYLLGWLKPTIISNTEKRIELKPLSIQGDSVLIMPNVKSDTPYQEFFIAEYRKRGVNNDSFGYPEDGMLIWHVDARVDSYNDNFLYNNQVTDHKLIKLVEADGLDEITSGQPADSGDYFLPPKSFGPDTNPNSKNYVGADTGVIINNLSSPGETMSATFGYSKAIKPVVEINLEKNANMLEVGKSQQLKLLSKYTDGTTEDVTSSAHWYTEDYSIVEVNNGLLIPKKIGKAKIVGYYEGFSIELNVTVVNRIAKISPDTEEIVIAPKRMISPKVFCEYSDGTKEDISTKLVWKSENSNVVANFLGYSLITKNIGETYIKAQYGNTEIKIKVIVVSDNDIEKIEVPDNNVYLYVGEEKKLQIMAVYPNGYKRDVTNEVSTWDITDPSIINLNYGIIKAIRIGTTELRAFYAGHQVSIQINVTKKINELKANKNSLVANIGETIPLVITAKYSDGTTEEVTDKVSWKVKDKNIISIANGKVAALSSGKTEIEASYKDFLITIYVEVTGDSGIKSLDISKNNLYLVTKEKEQLKLMATYQNGTIQDVTKKAEWVSSDPDVVNAKDGIISALKQGKAIVTASYEGMTIDVSVEVTNKVIKSLLLSKKKMNMKSNSTEQITVTAIYKDGTKEDVTEKAIWYSKDVSIAEVVNGVITAKRKGKTTITAEFLKKKVTVNVEVQDEKTLKSVQLSKKSITMTTQNAEQVKLTATFDDGSKEDITNLAEWSSTKPSIVKVDKGMVTALAKGKATIKVKYKDKTVYLNVTVK